MPLFETAIRKWMEIRAQNWLSKEFTSLGKDNLSWLIDHNRSILEFYTPGVLDSIKAEYAPLFRDADLFTWLSAVTQEVIKNHPHGMEWMREQERQLKERLGV